MKVTIKLFALLGQYLPDGAADNAQYYDWGLLSRAALLPTRENLAMAPGRAVITYSAAATAGLADLAALARALSATATADEVLENISRVSRSSSAAGVNARSV